MNAERHELEALDVDQAAVGDLQRRDHRQRQEGQCRERRLDLDAEVVAASDAVVAAARELGCDIEAPFQLLAFLALSVIPALKITDRGLVDVERFELVPLAVA